MPIVVLLDVSLSMSRPVVTQDSGKNHTRFTLAVAGVNALLDHLAANSKLEFVSLVAFSSLYEVVSGFTRDYDAIRQKLRQLEDFDKTCLEGALKGAYHMVLSEWGNQTHNHIVLVTDGCSGSAINAVTPSPVPSFPCSLHVVCVVAPNDTSLVASSVVYKRLIDRVGSAGTAPSGSLHVPEGPLSMLTVMAMFRKLCSEQLCAWRGTLRCGSLEARVTLAPAPLPHTHTTDFETIKLTMSPTLEICGFVSMQDIGSPMALSRHLVLPIPPPVLLTTPKPPTTPVKGESTETPSTPEEDPSDIGKPSFCVLLHGALKIECDKENIPTPQNFNQKRISLSEETEDMDLENHSLVVENMAALVQLGEDWYGLVHSWADSKKKSNLMLSCLPPGDDAVPWLGPLGQLGPADSTDQDSGFPVRSSERRSYAAAGAVWVRPAGLQADLHKLLRHARKLPEKAHHFNKEVNRVRRAALALGWVEALGAAATVLEREAALLPQAGPAITTAVQHLRECTDPKMQLPL